MLTTVSGFLFKIVMFYDVQVIKIGIIVEIYFHCIKMVKMLKEELKGLEAFLLEKQVALVKKQKHDYLMLQGLEAKEIYILKQGLVKVSNVFDDGREFNVSYLSEFDFVSLLEDDQDCACFDVRVESEEASFYCISRSDFKAWLNEDFQFCQIVGDFYRRRLALHVRQMSEMMINGKKGALCACLYRLLDNFGVPHKNGVLIDLRITNEALGNCCGISEKSSVNRLLQGLQSEGVIAFHRRRILVVQPEVLERYTI